MLSKRLIGSAVAFAIAATVAPTLALADTPPVTAQPIFEENFTLEEVKPAEITASTEQDTYAARSSNGDVLAEGSYFKVTQDRSTQYFVVVDRQVRAFTSREFSRLQDGLQDQIGGYDDTSNDSDDDNDSDKIGSVDRSAQQSGEFGVTENDAPNISVPAASLTTQPARGVVRSLGLAYSLNAAELAKNAPAFLAAPSDLPEGRIVRPSRETLVVRNGAVVYRPDMSLAKYLESEKPSPKPSPEPTSPAPTSSPDESPDYDGIGGPDLPSDTPDSSRPDTPSTTGSDEGENGEQRGTDDADDRIRDPNNGSNSVPVQAGEDWTPGQQTGRTDGVKVNDYSDPVPQSPGTGSDGDAIAGPAPDETGAENAQVSDEGTPDSSVASDDMFTGFPWALAALVTLGFAGLAAVLLVFTRKKGD